APKIDSGSLPRANDEIALGAKTMRQVGTHVGELVDVKINGKSRSMRVVGSTTLPVFGRTEYSEVGLGVGALVRADVFPQERDPTAPDGKYNYVLVRFADPRAKGKQVAQLREALAEGGCSDPTCVLVDQRPQEIDGYRSARGLPAAVGVSLALLLIATVTH